MRRITFLAFLFSAVPAPAFSQPAADPNFPPAPPEAALAEVQAPPEAPPAQAPPPPPLPASQAAPPSQVAPQPPAAPAGQWVYTNQYGWLWIPYGQQYTYIPGDLQVFPDQYVYYPVYGWRWVVAPWVYGYGPAPYWGAAGVRLFAWYARPWFRVGGYWGWGGYRGWGHNRGWVGPRAWGPRGWARAPSYYRSGIGGPHPAHVFRGEPVRRAAEHERGRPRGERRERER
jgi:hypothetical protein